MREARTIQRYGCDFCSKVATRPTIARHEPRCFKNPNRHCDACDNTGTTFELMDHGMGVIEVDVPCPYCVKYQQFLEDTKWREKVDNMSTEEKSELTREEIPF